MKYTCILLVILLASACDPAALPSAETAVSVVDTEAQGKLEDAMKLVLGAQAQVEFICEAFPASRSCTFLTATINHFYAVAVFVQDSLNAGKLMAPEVDSLLRVAEALAHAAETAYRSLS